MLFINYLFNNYTITLFHYTIFYMLPGHGRLGYILPEMCYLCSGSIRIKGIVELSGYAYALIVHSYLFKRVHILLRIGMQRYTEKEAEDIYREIDFLDMEGRVGLMIYRC